MQLWPLISPDTGSHYPSLRAKPKPQTAQREPSTTITRLKPSYKSCYSSEPDAPV